VGGEPIELLIDTGLLWMIIQLEAGADPIEQVRVLRGRYTRHLGRLLRRLRLDD
jgi:hypothetical protein